MKHHFFPTAGKFYKVNLHCHSTVSDGKYTPEELKELYKAEGYSALAFTDHEVLIGHTELCDDSFIALHGYEMSLNELGTTARVRDYPQMPVHHLCLIARRQDVLSQVMLDPTYVYPGNAPKFLPFISHIGPLTHHEYSIEYLNRLIATAKAHGFIVHYNHPRWSHQNGMSLFAMDGANGMEVHNSGSILDGDNNAIVYEDLLWAGKRLYPLAADDNHDDADMFGGFQMIKAPELSYEALTSALENGDSYASEGPLFQDMYTENGNLFVLAENACRISFLTAGRNRKMCENTDGSPLRIAAFPLPDNTPYFRIELTDEKGRMAWSRAYYQEEWT